MMPSMPLPVPTSRTRMLSAAPAARDLQIFLQLPGCRAGLFRTNPCQTRSPGRSGSACFPAAALAGIGSQVGLIRISSTANGWKSASGFVDPVLVRRLISAIDASPGPYRRKCTACCGPQQRFSPVPSPGQIKLTSAFRCPAAGPASHPQTCPGSADQDRHRVFDFNSFDPERTGSRSEYLPLRWSTSDDICCLFHVSPACLPDQRGPATQQIIAYAVDILKRESNGRVRKGIYSYSPCA